LYLPPWQHSTHICTLANARLALPGWKKDEDWQAQGSIPAVWLE